MRIDDKMVEKAYKKLKSSIYFDKTQLILRNSIVEFEGKGKIDDCLSEIYDKICDEDKFNRLKEKIIKSISIATFPKKLYSDKSDIIINSLPKENRVQELQHFINMDVEGHILGVLWIMLIGYKIDSGIYEHSYGNRIRKNLINDLSDNPTYSPYLFEPYFEQYESWRDKAMSEASRLMGKNQDAIIVTMDFRKYYYSVDADKKVLEAIYSEADIDDDGYTEDEIDILKRLNSFIYDVIAGYARLFKNEYGGLHILPIGFLPSNVIGNWCLKKFDKAVIDGWNPVYYGRYVDDVLIVDKVEKNSEIYEKAKNNLLSKEEVIRFFLMNCTKWVGMESENCVKSDEFALIQIDSEDDVENGDKPKVDNPENDVIFRVNPRYNAVTNNRSRIIVHNDKVKIFYFKSNESDALLTCFKDNISKNKSEFRHLPEDEAVFRRDDYSDIYTLESSDTINKFRGIEGIKLNKFELSKFLGKYLRIGGMIQDKVESKFEKDILKIFNYRTIIENYTTWEKIIEIFVINERFSITEVFVNQIIQAIKSIEFSEKDSIFSAGAIRNTLFKYLHSVLCRCFALVWKKERIDIQRRIYEIEDFKNSVLKIQGKNTAEGYLTKILKDYCETGMIDKTVLPINIFMISMENLISGNEEANLTRFKDVLSLSLKSWNSGYKYFPYLVNMFDFNMMACIEELKGNGLFSDIVNIQENQVKSYIRSNYCLNEKCRQWTEISQLIDVRRLKFEKDAYLVSVGNGKKSKIKVAIANVKLDHKNFSKLVKGRPNRSYARYRDLSFVVNQAIDQQVDMLIMPESFVPYEWLSTLARTCARNDLAIITGIEHLLVNGNIYNLTAVILPYTENRHKCANITFHLKTHYAPGEKEEINGYRLKEMTGEHYELYKWNDCYFPVYCCYELTSIADRAMFQSYADMLIAVEWNRDVNYYSNILGSLSRDIHCYCIQVNSSNYGDSRIAKPSKTEEKDIIRTKGGVNSSILVEELDISQLRNFQIKEYSLQKRENIFKPTPPDFDSDIVMKKIKNEDLFK